MLVIGVQGYLEQTVETRHALSLQGNLELQTK